MPRARSKISGVYMQGVNPLNWTGNGRLAYAQCAAELARFGNMLAGKRRRILWSQHRRPTTVTGSASTANFDYYGYIRPSYQGGIVRVELICIPADNISGGTGVLDQPHVQVTVSAVGRGGAGGVQFRRMFLNRRDVGTIVPNDYIRISQKLTRDQVLLGTGELLAPGNTYAISIQANRYARIISAMVFEEQADSLERQKLGDTNSGAGPDITTGTTLNADTLSDSSAEWDASYIGARLIIDGASTGGNDGEFFVTSVHSSGEDIRYVNPGGATTESFGPGTSYVLKDRTTGRIANVRTGTDIISSQIEDLNQFMQHVWDEGGGFLFTYDLNATKTRGTASYVNVFDTSVSAYGANNRGFWTWPEKMGSYESNQVPVVFWAYAKRAAGASAVNVKFEGSAGAIATLSFNSGSAEFQTATGYLDASLTEQKVDVLFQGNGTASSCELYAFGAYQCA